MIKKIIFYILILGILGAGRFAWADPSTEARYEDVWMDNKIHPIFLQRIANIPNCDQWNIQHYTRPSDRTSGIYLLATNSNQLDTLFSQVARKIKLRLVP